MKSYILLENITFFANHGVFPQEKKVGNVFVVSLKIKVDFSKSCLSDNLEDTVSYASVYEDVKKEMDIPSKLLEHVAYRIIYSLKEKYSEIEEVEIKLSKRNPPVGGQIDYASVVLID
ncbi:dihydroneopterin aldolase [Dysgonomonas sp. Marseille-P4361]|uniref:dihydroneopterin aldolase n=1 Tax=Dysgonomonas sp. Marseille-P4361 TaxID=2161820 RepID=UPI000D560D3F|nr:dihydroneopterin aldolase [Dysgonomonas sp. Marseille-P4361]